jgi:hypothetical protein
MLIEGKELALFRHCENRLDAVRKRFTISRGIWEKVPLIERRNYLLPVITTVTKSPEFTEEFLKYQVGDDEAEWGPSPEDRIDLSPLANQRIETACAKRTNVLWPWLLFTGDENKQFVDEFLDDYYQIAQLIGLFPFSQKIENVHMQRMLHPKHRALAATLMFINDCIKNP